MKKNLLFLLFIYNFIQAQYSISTTERNALITIYNQTNSNNWSQKWDLTKDPYYWYGVKTENGAVTELKLNGNVLEGNFPSAILSLTQLKKIDLSSNNLSGNVPNLSSLNNLTHLNISHNNFDGDLYSAFSSLTSLEHLLLGNNNEATISSTDFSAFSQLKTLDVSKLNLTEIPPSLSALSSLKNLNVSNNTISNFSNLSSITNLEELNISGNQLTQIPTEIGNLSQLKILNASNNTITQFSALNSLVNLEWLSLENNALQNIPTEINNLQNLVHLNLGHNLLASNFSAIASLPKLEQLWLNHNKVSLFPAEVLALPQLMSLFLHSNQLFGEIPLNIPEICNISNNKYSAVEIQNFLDQKPNNTDFVYSPQRYDEAKTEKAVLASSVSLKQLLSSTEGFAFTWYKTLENKTSVFSESYNINSVKEADFDQYTCEAILIKDKTLYVLDIANFREPITLEKDESLATENPEEKILAIYPNPVKDFLYIKNNNYKIENYTLYDLGGKVVQSFSGKENKLNFSKLPSANYILSIKTSLGYHNFKIIKK